MAARTYLSLWSETLARSAVGCTEQSEVPYEVATICRGRAPCSVCTRALQNLFHYTPCTNGGDIDCAVLTGHCGL